MPLMKYKDWRPQGRTLLTLNRAQTLLQRLYNAGYTPTLRQLYYQFVARDWIENTPQQYERLGRIVTDAREGGLIDWLHIEDRGRNVARIKECTTYEDLFDKIEMELQFDPWKEQDVYLEVAVEKDALVGVVARPASRWRAPYLACKGYLSASEAWRMGLRYQRAVHEGRKPVMLHLGDHDPSGIDMTRDNRERASLFAQNEVEVNRIALNKDQIEEHDCPPNPAKTTDSRSTGYVQEHGKISWELDALPPEVLDKLISDQIEQYVDKDRWEAVLEREAEMRKPLALLKPRWEEVVKLALHPERPMDALKQLREAKHELQAELQSDRWKMFPNVQALSVTLDIEPPMFIEPENHVEPVAEMPWDVLDDEDLPEGYTDNEPAA